GEKIEQVREALSYCLNSLNERDKFNIVTFNDESHPFSEKTLNADKDNVKRARDFVEDIEAGGGTNIDAALATALETTSGDNGPAYIMFLTDGKPTVGARDAADIIANYRNNSAAVAARLFNFGVGYKVNADLLDSLSSRNGGLTTYVKPGEDVEVSVSNFYDKIAAPVLTDIEIAYDGLKVYDIYPSMGDDLFAGTQLTVLGRYKGNFTGGAITISGMRGGKSADFRFEVSPPNDERTDFLAPLWAARKIGYCLDEIRLNGENEELIGEIVALSKEYGIVTPYTSYLVEDTDVKVSRDTRGTWRNGNLENDAVWAGATGAYKSASGGLSAPEAGIDMNINYTGRDISSEGELRVAEAETLAALKKAERLVNGKNDEYIRIVKGKVFVEENGVWVDLAIGNERDR
ncbi:MAG: VWA domain-containing protein, partial [bacterium]|nr:VWA domain-containing protein [bacterium]